MVVLCLNQKDSPEAMKKKRRKTKTTRPSDDYGSPERALHADGLIKEVRDRLSSGQPKSFGMRAKAECKLDRYWNRMLLNWRQYQAGLIIRRLHIAANMQPWVTMHYEVDHIANAGGFWLDNCNDAKKRLRSALLVLEPKLALVIMRVCGDDEWVNSGGTYHHRGLSLLRDGLNRLADHFKISDVDLAI